jgi:hypothetical protein
MPAAAVGAALAAALTLGAGLVHALVAAEHAGHGGHGTAVALFAATATAQAGLGLALAARPRRGLLAASVALNVAAAGAWAVSRTAGLPAVAALAGRQPVGLQDLVATASEVLAAVAAVVAVAALGAVAAVGALGATPVAPGAGPAAPLEGRRRLAVPALALAAVPALVGLAAPHAHAPAVAADPVLAGIDPAGASPAHLEAATTLVRTTRAAVAGRFTGEASVVAAGYRSIGDGARLGRYEHFVHAAYLADGRELDPERVESIVMEGPPGAKRVVSAMYILEPGRTLADAPDVAGPLASWHDHQNLCWADTGIRLAGVLVGGRCVPGGTFHPTPPMLHVWLDDHPCGPFAGIEGHGGGCGRGHHTG